MARDERDRIFSTGWQENRNRDAARGTGNRRTGFAWRTGMEDAAEGDGEQENGIGLENGN